MCESTAGHEESFSARMLRRDALLYWMHHHRTSPSAREQPRRAEVPTGRGGSAAAPRVADLTGVRATWPRTDLGDRFKLSQRELDVASLIADGLSYDQTARRLSVSRGTIGFHLGNIYAKVGVSSRHELTQMAHSLSLAS